MPVDINELKSYLAARGKRVDAALDAFLPRPNRRPSTIHKAMRHSVFAGGKRLRPVLYLLAAAAAGSQGEPRQAAIFEYLHAATLLHDDVVDISDLRRGRPTCHKVFGEGMAVLCGDALLTEAFAVLARIRPTPRYRTGDFVRELAETGGSRKLIGGQVMDLEGEGKPLDKGAIVRIHETKTAALLATSLRLGAMSANATPVRLDAVTRFGRALGLAFQVIDDILDVTQSSETLGKTAGKDAAADKATFPAILGLDASRREAARLTRSAMRALDPLRGNADRLRQIADYLLVREY